MVLDLNFNFLALKKDVMSTKMYTMRLLFKQNTDYVIFIATLYKYIIIALTLFFNFFGADLNALYQKRQSYRDTC